MFPTLHRWLHILSNTLAKFKLFCIVHLIFVLVWCLYISEYLDFGMLFNSNHHYWYFSYQDVCATFNQPCLIFPREECFCILCSHNFLLFSKALKECSTPFQEESAKKNKHIFMKSVVIMSSGIPWVETIDRVISQQYKNTTLQTQWRNLRARLQLEHWDFVPALVSLWAE